jgi:hypothetical protein
VHYYEIIADVYPSRLRGRVSEGQFRALQSLWKRKREGCCTIVCWFFFLLLLVIPIMSPSIILCGLCTDIFSDVWWKLTLYTLAWEEPETKAEFCRSQGLDVKDVVFRPPGHLPDDKGQVYFPEDVVEGFRRHGFMAAFRIYESGP